MLTVPGLLMICLGERPHYADVYSVFSVDYVNSAVVLAAQSDGPGVVQ